MQLCDHCNSIFKTSESLENLAKSRVWLCRGRQDGATCGLRRLTWDLIEAYNNEITKTTEPEKLAEAIISAEDPRIFLKSMPNDEGKYDNEQIGMFCLIEVLPNKRYHFAPLVEFEVSADEASKYILNRSRERNLNTEKTYDQIRSWLSKCTESHDDCSKPKKHQLPTRVLDIGPNEGSPSIYTTSGSIDHYLVLSYCWGGPQTTLLTSKSFPDMSQKIALDSLPLCFQDAITITRNLGFRYLWIDALCIIQDSLEDKEKELAQMAQIYQNALLTISATGSSKVRNGFLNTRQAPKSLVQPFKMPFFLSDNKDDFGEVTLQELQWYNAYLEPLNRRGWALQERLLSPRVLIYATTHLRWQCQTNESSYGGLSEYFLPGCEKLHPSFFAGERRDFKAKLYIVDDWINVVKDYSTRKLTYPNDKLVAISAIASKFQKMGCGKYVAGLWEDSLLEGLMWMIDQSVKPLPLFIRPRQKRAPSWSWAGIDGNVSFGGSDIGFAEIINCETDLVDANIPLGPVRGGTLEIRAQIKEASLKDINILSDVDEKVGVIGRGWQDAVEELSDPITCLRLGKAVGLMLQRVSGNVFQRVGFAEIREKAKSWWEGSETQHIFIV